MAPLEWQAMAGSEGKDLTWLIALPVVLTLFIFVIGHCAVGAKLQQPSRLTALADVNALMVTPLQD